MSCSSSRMLSCFRIPSLTDIILSQADSNLPFSEMGITSKSYAKVRITREHLSMNTVSSFVCQFRGVLGGIESKGGNSEEEEIM